MPLAQTRKTAQVKCEDCPIRHHAVCSNCDSDELEVLERVKSYRTYQPGEAIVWAGEKTAADRLGRRRRGDAFAHAARWPAPDGRASSSLRLPRATADGTSSKFDVVAATPVTFCMFRKADFERVVAQSPRIEQRLLEMTSTSSTRPVNGCSCSDARRPREKIASLFVIMGRRDAALNKVKLRGGLVFPFYITREAMADYLGLTIETVSRQISALRKEGLIDLNDNRMVRVPDFAALIEESGDDSDGGVLV